ncbi:EscU/YscU/HrcU family type III secretion system export apparatus switch protein [Pseudomonas simiae]|uniref:EscU/YscU/HrcU family type III secretion system export apparatus switch protein n=1 Tax=Pseudomonas simiae TaxID=321846 RepID=A0ABS9G4X6_9PSED|nr:type III secretion system export apparatus subunit SctU [Pseudomonas simiae]MCF5048207.1 EscU/YscU/HrcU family type III secretion system export apparatus switch protein [Pseudomonas simiae]MCF5185779.1 EscU/YscU/HrcU family type III secretion system export apparatus switch protein [Pseudomonas simiae]MCF5285759.1 EscU/YscU/HrcU family type III secretion system export apparatus switch protein [Pseudomonas simiae]MCF5318538.1 EscU/YscU/HrcU family type III secretion system export apparatus swi
MSDSGEKKHPASAKKLRDQRKKGQVAQSQDVAKQLALTAISEIALFTAETSLQRFQQLMLLPISRLNQPFTRALEEVLFDGLGVFFSFALLMVGVAITTKLISSWMQFGLLFAPEALKMDFNRLNPVSQVKQMFSAQQLMNLLMSVTKAFLIGLILYVVIRPSVGTLINLATSDLQSYIVALIALFRHLLHVCFGMLLVLALVDLILSKHFFAKRMRMTQVEVVKEYKDMEGDPHVKGQRRSLAYQLAQEEPKVKLPKLEESDMLVVNPTHFAVALYYRPGKTPLPMLVSKGTDDEARKLIRRAKAADVPVIQCVWLARTLYTKKLGASIPRETLQAVALIYRTLRELDDEAKRETLELPELERR